MRYPPYIEKKITFPDFYRVRRLPPSKALDDPVGTLKNQLLPALNAAGIKPGQTVALGVGSRGIADISDLIACICNCLGQMGAHPWIIPAMGSHGSATEKGQLSVLEKLGITEGSCGAQFFPQLDVTRLTRVFDTVPVYFSSKAMEADHTICINRIKPHTKFKGSIESGLYKMMVVGLGKHKGALTYHNHALQYGFASLLKEMGNAVVETSNICLGIGVVEDHTDRIMHIDVVPVKEIPAREPELLEMAKAHFPSLPYQDLDVLIVGQIGKEISGSGMDPNVTGRTCDFMEDDFSKALAAKRVAILDLSKKTAGNAIGLGNADIITEKVFQKMDYEATLMNALTSMSLKKAAIPVRLPSEEKAIQAAFQTIGPIAPDDVRAVIIKDTIHMNEFLISRALVTETERLQHVGEINRQELKFSPSRDLIF